MAKNKERSKILFRLSKAKGFLLISVIFVGFFIFLYLKEILERKNVLNEGIETTGVIYEIDKSKLGNTIGERYKYFYISNGILHKGVELYNELIDDVEVGQLVTLKYLESDNRISVVEKIEKETCNCTIFHGEVINTDGYLKVSLKYGDELTEFNFVENYFFVPIVNGEENVVSFYDNSGLIKSVYVNATSKDKSSHLIKSSLDGKVKKKDGYDLKLIWNNQNSKYDYVIR